MADLTETTLAHAMDGHQTVARLSSTSGIAVGDWIFSDGEAMQVVSLPVSGTCRVMRGVGGSAATPHVPGMAVFAGPPHRFHSTDPKGQAAAAPEDNPWVNVPAGRVFRAGGDAVGPGREARYWHLIETTYTPGALGVRTSESAPTS